MINDVLVKIQKQGAHKKRVVHVNRIRKVKNPAALMAQPEGEDKDATALIMRKIQDGRRRGRPNDRDMARTAPSMTLQEEGADAATELMYTVILPGRVQASRQRVRDRTTRNEGSHHGWRASSGHHA